MIADFISNAPMLLPFSNEVHFWSADHRHLVYGLAEDSLRAGTYREYMSLSEAKMSGPSRSFGVVFENGS